MDSNPSDFFLLSVPYNSTNLPSTTYVYHLVVALFPQPRVYAKRPSFCIWSLLLIVFLISSLVLSSLLFSCLLYSSLLLSSLLMSCGCLPSHLSLCCFLLSSLLFRCVLFSSVLFSSVLFSSVLFTSVLSFKLRKSVKPSRFCFCVVLLSSLLVSRFRILLFFSSLLFICLVTVFPHCYFWFFLCCLRFCSVLFCCTFLTISVTPSPPQ